MKFLIGFLFFLFIILQYQLWYGPGSVEQVNEYQQQVDSLKREAAKKRERNEALYAEVLDLREAQEAIEERARYELGMIKEGETFFQVID
jgi:cell division protein FtsB